MQTYKQRSPTHGHTSVSQTARAYYYQLCADIAYRLEDLPIGKRARIPLAQQDSMMINANNSNDGRYKYKCPFKKKKRNGD